jgi:hypothetical protein
MTLYASPRTPQVQIANPRFLCPRAHQAFHLLPRFSMFRGPRRPRRHPRLASQASLRPSFSPSSTFFHLSPHFPSRRPRIPRPRSPLCRLPCWRSSCPWAVNYWEARSLVQSWSERIPLHSRIFLSPPGFWPLLPTPFWRLLTGRLKAKSLRFKKLDGLTVKKHPSPPNTIPGVVLKLLSQGTQRDVANSG